MNDPRGSQWRKWDLHVHTPASLIHDYEGVEHDVWETFLRDVEALPTEFKVLGINDYIFLDGYKRLLNEKQRNQRLQNIDLLLPVIELRLDKFVGSGGHLAKINYHVLFSDEIDPNIIEEQFLASLWAKYRLSPAFEGLQKQWKARPTRESITDLGQLIIDSVPEQKKPQFKSPLMEGFANLTISMEAIDEALTAHYFKDKFISGVGKAEWGSMRWNDHSIADKKNVINHADIVFTAAESPDDYQRSRKRLKEEGVNDYLLDCSDAHRLSMSAEKDRMGNCFTWIKADCTFAGLKHALLEFDARVFIGDEPSKLKTVRQNPTHYIKSISFRRLDSDLDEVWFSGEVPFNHDLVAIIGNKGNGKSALADTIALLGHSHQDRFFSFLNEQRFRDPKHNKAVHFEAVLNWEGGHGKYITLDADVRSEEVELVKYIPQNFLEHICNDGKGSRDTDFDSELKKIIFSHVPASEQLDSDSLDALIASKTSETNHLIDALRLELETINTAVASCEERLTIEHRKQIENNLELKVNELRQNERIRPAPVEKPDLENSLETKSLVTAVNIKDDIRAKMVAEISEMRRLQVDRNIALNALEKITAKISNFSRSFEVLRRDTAEDLKRFGIEFNSVLTLTVNLEPLQKSQTELSVSRSNVEAQLDASGNSKVQQLASIEMELSQLRSKLDEPNLRYQTYLKDFEEWEAKQRHISGDEHAPGSLIYYKNQLDDLSTIPTQLGSLLLQRQNKSQEIFERTSRLADTYRGLYRAVNEFIHNHSVVKDKLQLNFQVSIENTEFEDKFFDYVSRGISGSFMGTDEGRDILKAILKKYNFNDWQDVSRFTEEIIDHLHFDRRTAAAQPIAVGQQLRKSYTVSTLYDYIFSLGYLRPKYTLKLADKELAQLSPGEKGALLLIFYLLVDRGQMPLIIDQPEENLDNQTMFNLLVPCLREAKKKRQVIIVTHNPNLAVVADSEQVIYAFLDKTNKCTMTYTSGALENPVINRKVLDVLEGTRPAFDNRADKYQA